MTILILDAVDVAARVNARALESVSLSQQQNYGVALMQTGQVPAAFWDGCVTVGNGFA